jgi:hypothetical protein
MPIKTTKRISPEKPVVRFFLAEDLRQELHGKLTAVGLYPDNVVIVGLPDTVPAPSATNPIIIRSLALAFSVSKLSKTEKISVDIETNGIRRVFFPAKDYPWPGVGRSTNMLAVMEPCTIEQFGVRKVFVIVGEDEYEFEYEIRRGSLPTLLQESSIKQLSAPEQDQATPTARKKTTKRKTAT